MRSTLLCLVLTTQAVHGLAQLLADQDPDCGALDTDRCCKARCRKAGFPEIDHYDDVPVESYGARRKPMQRARKGQRRPTSSTRMITRCHDTRPSASLTGDRNLDTLLTISCRGDAKAWVTTMPLLYPIQVNGQPVWHSKKGFCLPSRERVAEWQKKHPNGDKMAQYQRERDEARAREPDTGKPKKGRPRKPPPVEWYEDRDRGSDDEDSDDELTGISGEVEAEINDEDMQEGELESPSRGQTLEEEQEQIEAADELAGHRWGAKRARSEALQSARMRYKSINHIVGTEASTSRPGTSCADLSDQGYEDTFEVHDPYVLFAAEILASIAVPDPENAARTAALVARKEMHLTFDLNGDPKTPP